MFPQIFGKYVLERELAAGGMARVFLATLRGAKGFEKRLVVKQIRPELASDQAFIQRFVSEAKTTVELSHSNIVPVYELGVEQGVYYIALEYCEGVALNELLAEGALSPAEGAYVGVEICRALDYAHRRASVVHRDVTPRNVMVDPEGMVRLIDFGIASPVAGGTGGERGSVFGSPGHMPPEQLAGAPLTPAADVFAVAALLVEVWTGRAPFRRETPAASIRALADPQASLSEADAELAPLAELVRLALDKDPRRRPQSAEELARPLREFLKASDLGDLARRLGARVSARLVQQPPQSGGAAPVGAAAQSSAGHTLTFASAEAVRSSTGEVKTGAFPSRPPAQLNTGRSERASVTPPLGVGALDAFTTASVDAPSRASARRAPRARWALFGALLVLGVLVSGAYWLRGSPAVPVASALAAPDIEAPVPVSAVPTPLSPELTLLSPEPTPPVAAPAPPQSVPAPSATATATATRTSAPAPRAPVSRETPPRETTSVQPADGARLSLTADPPAQVEIDRVKLGRTPLINLNLRPGRHVVVFTSAALGERLTTDVTLAAGAPRSVHADFTSASPQLYVR